MWVWLGKCGKRIEISVFKTSEQNIAHIFVLCLYIMSPEVLVAYRVSLEFLYAYRVSQEV